MKGVLHVDKLLKNWLASLWRSRLLESFERKVWMTEGNFLIGMNFPSQVQLSRKETRILLENILLWIHL